MRADEVRLGIRFLTESRGGLVRRRSELAAEFSRELSRCRRRCEESLVLRGEDVAALEADEAMESDAARALIRDIASHPKLGVALRRLAGEIDEIDTRLATIDIELHALTGAQ